MSELAGRFRRLLATIVDAILLLALTFVLVIVAGAVEHAEDYVGLRILWQILGLMALAYVVLNGITLELRGQTLGKALFGIKVVALDVDARPPVWSLVVRPVAFLLLPVISPCFILRRDRRCLHDLLASTEVRRV